MRLAQCARYVVARQAPARQHVVIDMALERVDAAVGGDHALRCATDAQAGLGVAHRVEQLVDQRQVRQAQVVAIAHARAQLGTKAAGRVDELAALDAEQLEGGHVVQRIDLARIEIGIGHHHQSQHARKGLRAVGLND
jgi:hypothetical protein